MDALVYFWIFQSLMDTMDELTDKKQDAKLAIFTKLRNLLIVSVVVATTTLIIFSYIIVTDYSRNVWKIQWLYVFSSFIIHYSLQTKNTPKGCFLFLLLLLRAEAVGRVNDVSVKEIIAQDLHLQHPFDAADHAAAGHPELLGQSTDLVNAVALNGGGQAAHRNEAAELDPTERHQRKTCAENGDRDNHQRNIQSVARNTDAEHRNGGNEQQAVHDK